MAPIVIHVYVLLSLLCPPINWSTAVLSHVMCDKDVRDVHIWYHVSRHRQWKSSKGLEVACHSVFTYVSILQGKDIYLFLSFDTGEFRNIGIKFTTKLKQLLTISCIIWPQNVTTQPSPRRVYKNLTTNLITSWLLSLVWWGTKWRFITLSVQLQAPPIQGISQWVFQFVPAPRASLYIHCQCVW